MKVRVSVTARRDIVRLTDFLGGRSAGPADRAIDAIEAALFSLTTMADRGYRGPREGERQLFVPFGQAGYVIQYKAGPGMVTVLRIFHAREDGRV